ncbi:12758_t:CDS:2 [Ambispora gerdemannii]|uniref:12758_t:CDS:1 n=1 Tax=Ambispora gerdemannii TaxID=144530 RepID=A0A9N8YZK6_9GLOM|nr:12758_t:CDS:2 [Ambispora gerdemannii]
MSNWCKRESCSECKDFEGFWCQTCDTKIFREDWTSGNAKLDKLIKKSLLFSTQWDSNFMEWIPYEQFKGMDLIGRGGFGAVFKAEWTTGRRVIDCNGKYSREKCAVAIKQANGSMDMDEFLSYPETKAYLLVLPFAENGDLRSYLLKTPEMKWRNKLVLISRALETLCLLHDGGYVHRDMHSGNILCKNGVKAEIADFGLSLSLKGHTKESGVYGVLPYVAPEVLRGSPYSQASEQIKNFWTNVNFLAKFDKADEIAKKERANRKSDSFDPSETRTSTLLRFENLPEPTNCTQVISMELELSSGLDDEEFDFE